MRWFLGIFDRFFAFFSGIAFLQVPSFISQYTDYLQGRVDELGVQVEAYRSVAAQGSKTIRTYIAKFLANSDPEIAAQGQLMEENLLRFDQLSSALASLKSATPLDRGLRFLQHIQSEYIGAVWKNFQLSLDLTFEALIYGGVGIVFAYCVTRFLRWILVGRSDHDFTTEYP
jgi:hypothetical protein